jgi:flagellar motor switch/type III secretory pathway protein FliN
MNDVQTEYGHEVTDLDDLAVSMTFEAGRVALSLASLDTLIVGSLLRLSTTPGQVSLRVQGRCIGEGRLVMLDGEPAVEVLGLVE